MKLRSKVFFIFILISIIPLLFITFVAYSRYIVINSQRIENLTSNVFNNAEQELNNTISTIKQTAGLFTFYSDGDFSIIENLKGFSDPNAAHTDYDAFRANENIKFVCQNILYSYNYIYGLYVFTPSGVILDYQNSLNGGISNGYSPTDKDWYKDTLKLNGDIYVSSVADHDMFSGERKSIFFWNGENKVWYATFNMSLKCS